MYLFEDFSTRLSLIVFTQNFSGSQAVQFTKTLHRIVKQLIKGVFSREVYCDQGLEAIRGAIRSIRLIAGWLGFEPLCQCFLFLGSCQKVPWQKAQEGVEPHYCMYWKQENGTEVHVQTHVCWEAEGDWRMKGQAEPEIHWDCCLGSKFKKIIEASNIQLQNVQPNENDSNKKRKCISFKCTHQQNNKLWEIITTRKSKFDASSRTVCIHPDTLMRQVRLIWGQSHVPRKRHIPGQWIVCVL